MVGLVRFNFSWFGSCQKFISVPSLSFYSFLNQIIMIIKIYRLFPTRVRIHYVIYFCSKLSFIGHTFLIFYFSLWTILIFRSKLWQLLSLLISRRRLGIDKSLSDGDFKKFLMEKKLINFEKLLEKSFTIEMDFSALFLSLRLITFLYYNYYLTIISFSYHY